MEPHTYHMPGVKAAGDHTRGGIPRCSGTPPCPAPQITPQTSAPRGVMAGGREVYPQELTVMTKPDRSQALGRGGKHPAEVPTRPFSMQPWPWGGETEPDPRACSQDALGRYGGPSWPAVFNEMQSSQAEPHTLQQRLCDQEVSRH